MIFNSFEFLLFSFLIVLLYWLLPLRFARWMLLLASLFFYSTFLAAYTLLFVFMTVLVYGFGLVLQKNKNRWYFFSSICVALFPLVLTKYSHFIFPQTSFSIIAPLGISFFTFEYIHFLVDVYKDKQKVPLFLDFCLFVFFFPTQLAGPIKRFEEFVPQLQQKVFNYRLFCKGLHFILLGLLYKVVLADPFSTVVTAVYDSEVVRSGGDIWIATILFTFQIFFDFAGYSLCSIGLAACFGFIIPANFNEPYISSNLSEFWRRWHISLMSWFQDYVYFPLGGSRKGKLRQIINTIIVFLVSGLWHGAAWHFVFWGGYHSIGLIISRYLEKISVPTQFHWIQKTIGVCLTFVFVMIGWIFFRASSVSVAVQMLIKMMTTPFEVSMQKIEYQSFLVLLGLFLVVFLLRKLLSVFPFKQYIPLSLRYVAGGVGYASILFLVCVYFRHSPVQFIYFQF